MNSKEKALTTKIATKRAELNDPYTRSLGKAAIRSVAETLAAAEYELETYKASKV